MPYLTINLHTKQKGAALLIFFLAIIAAGAVFLLTNSASNSSKVTNQNKTTQSLSQAKSALLGYAVSYYLNISQAGTLHAGHHGLLPCPETSGSVADGVSVGQCSNRYTNSLGRFPWRSLDVEPFKDASGECLWYAVSGGFFNSPKSELTNHDTPGNFQIFDHNGTLITGANAEDRVIAVIIAPGISLSGQSRSSAVSGLPCKVSRTNAVANKYLDSYQGINNSSVDNTNENQIEQFITTTGLSDNPSLNDRIVTISSKEIFAAIKLNASLYSNKIQALGQDLSNCLITHAIARDDILNTPGACQTTCDSAENLCSLSATTDLQRSTCINTRINCRSACTSPATTEFQFPWPAPVNLGFADSREDTSYIDLDSAGTASQGLLGRLPFNISNSQAITGLSSLTNTIFDYCANDLTTESGIFWQHWKDHWFYIVGRDYQPGSSQSGTNCTQCPVFNGSTNKYAAILMFSSERNPGQLRRSNHLENPDPAFADSLYSISNYLEGSNASNYTDTDGDKTYATYSVTDTPNDLLFCIRTDMSAVSGVCP